MTWPSLQPLPIVVSLEVMERLYGMVATSSSSQSPRSGNSSQKQVSATFAPPRWPHSAARQVDGSGVQE